jgi:SNF2 family DNA or RNA helicase
VLSELPPKTDTTLFCEFTDSQRAVYDQALLTARQELEDISEKASFTMLRLLLRLRLIACHPALCVKKSRTTLTSGKQEAVFHAAMEILSEGHKILIFSQFTRHLKLAQAPFQRLSVPSFYLDGKTADRARVVRDFQDHPGPCLFFISLKTGGTGLNLSEADYVFLLDPWWNPAVENQAIDRCHRLGQKNAVTVYRFITRGSIEEKVNELKGIKKDIEEALIRDSAPERSVPDEAALKSLLLSGMDQ